MRSTENTQKTDTVTQVFFMPTVFNETMQLLVDAREYFAVYGPEDQQRIEGTLKTIYSSEMSRITLRLSSIMAWIMVQRAVTAGKISREDAAKHYGLDFKDICMVENSMLHGILPSYVCHLLDRSLELYARVERLDDQFKKLH